jgi:beta-glucoside operon transcriptional antiterminator
MSKTYFKIRKVLNNNAIIAEIEGIEIIATGNGIGWQYSAGEMIEHKDSYNIYKLQSKQMKNQLETLLNEIPFKCIELTEQIIDKAKETLRQDYNQNLIITLADHIHFAVKRYKEGIVGYGMALEEIKRFYREEYLMGITAVEMINDKYQIALKKDEANMIAFHFINAQFNSNVDNTSKIVKSIEDIVQIIETSLGINFEEDSFDYSRLIIHLKFFMKRLFSEGSQDDNSVEELFMSTNSEMKKAASECLNTISNYLKVNFDKELPQSERFYLLIHIVRVMQVYNKF